MFGKVRDFSRTRPKRHPSVAVSGEHFAHIQRGTFQVKSILPSQLVGILVKVRGKTGERSFSGERNHGGEPTEKGTQLVI